LNFSIAYPYWYLILCIAFGVLLACGLYFKNKKFTKNTSWFLGILRALAGSLIAFMLLNPVLKWMQTKTEQPTIVILQDNSSSQNKAFEKINKQQYTAAINEQIELLSKQYKVDKYSYGATLNDTGVVNYKESTTNIGKALELINSTYENSNLGAVIITGDGIYNQGASPTTFKAVNGAPVYAVGIGDTNIQRDALITKTYANKVVYLGDKFSVKVDALGYACNGVGTTLSIVNNSGNERINNPITFVGNRSNKQSEFILSANKKGIQHYSAIIGAVNGDVNTINNKQDFYVEVIDSKQKVGIICNSPHPDVNAIQEALSVNKNSIVEIFTADKAGTINVIDYNLLILHNLPSNANPIANILSSAKTNGTGMLYITGAQTNLNAFNTAQNIVTIKSGAGGVTDVIGVPAKGFNLFTVNADQANKVSLLPPMSGVFGTYNVGPNTSVLFNQKIGNSTTNNPIWILQQNGSNRQGVIAAEGIWRWRMYDYLQHKNHSIIDGFIEKTVQYLVVKQDKKQFRVNINKTINSVNDNITFDAELYNDNYELINTGEVNMVIASAKGNRYNYTFNKLEKGFNLSVGTLPAGQYNYEAKSVANGVIRTANGSFTVVDIDIENINTTADFSVLNNLATNNNGQFLFNNQIGELNNLITKNNNIKAVIRQDIEAEPIINWKWLFGIILALLGTEWFVRKRSGGY
jgi:hypothetical protein